MKGYQGTRVCRPTFTPTVTRPDMGDSCYNEMPGTGQYYEACLPKQHEPQEIKLSELNSSLEEILKLEKLVKRHRKEANRQVSKTGHSTVN